MEIQACKDYRDFLKFQVEKKKESTKSFSYQAFASKIGVSKAYLKLLIEKKSHASLDRIFDIVHYFKLLRFETQYLVFLFLQNTSKAGNAKQFFTFILRSYRLPRSKIEYQLLNEDYTNINLTSWVYFAVCHMMKFKTYRHDLNWIKNVLGGDEMVSDSQITQAMKEAEEEGYIKRIADGWEVQTKPFSYINIPPWDGILIQGFKKALQRVATAIDHFKKTDFHSPCRYQLYTVAVNEEGSKQMIKAYDRFQKQLIAIASETYPDADRLMLVSNNIFRVSKKTDSI